MRQMYCVNGVVFAAALVLQQAEATQTDKLFQTQVSALLAEYLYRNNVIDMSLWEISSREAHAILKVRKNDFGFGGFGD